MDQLREVFVKRAAELRTWPEIRDLARVFSSLELDPVSSCWLWTGSKTSGGYGTLAYMGRRHVAHRATYMLMGGTIELNMTLDHLCRNRACVNPAHLEPCSLEENVRRGWEANRNRPNRNREKASCPQGHLYDETNTHTDGAGGRKCRLCDRQRKMARRRSSERAEREREIRRASYHRNKGARLPPPAERTHCPRGHEYTAENIYRTPSGGRACRECRRIWSRETEAKRAAG